MFVSIIIMGGWIAMYFHGGGERSRVTDGSYHSLQQVKVLYARNLTQECTEEALKQAFEIYGKIERVKKIKDYAFIHFEERENALKVRFLFAIIQI